MAIDYVLVITSLIFSLLILASSFYFLIYFQHPADSNTAYLPKITVIIGLALATYNIFLLPLDVANDIPGDIMGHLTITAHVFTVFLAAFVFPFAKIWYNSVGEEEKDEEGNRYAYF
jgi:LMBR1 domain-containing protein 1